MKTAGSVQGFQKKKKKIINTRPSKQGKSHALGDRALTTEEMTGLFTYLLLPI
jgi:hypothetical protein